MSSAIVQFFMENAVNQKRLDIALERYSKAIGIIERYEEAGELIQKEFGDIKWEVGKLFDELKGFEAGAYKIKPLIPYNELTKMEVKVDDIPLDRRGVNKYLRALHAVDPEKERAETVEYVSKVTPIFEEMAEINNRVDAFKELVVKKKRADVAKSEAKQQEEAKRASHGDVKRVRGFLVELTENGRQAIFEDILVYEKRIQAHKLQYLQEEGFSIPQGSTRRGEPEPRYNFGQLRGLMAEKNGYEYGPNRTYIINVASPDVLEKRVSQDAQRQTDALVDQYVHRVTEKLAYIIAKKDCLKDITSSDMRLTRAIEANLDLTFNDGSSFTLVTSTEIAANPVNPGYHVKIPSRFTNVIKSDGSRLKNPSEKSVQDELAP